MTAVRPLPPGALRAPDANQGQSPSSTARSALPWYRARRQTSIFSFVLLISATNLILFQMPLLEYSISVSALPSMNGWLQIVSVEIFQFCLMAGILFLISTVSIKIVKALSSVLAVANSIALYFMLTYNIELDRTMIGNILNTDSREASGLWHYSIIPYIVFLGILPASVIWWARVRRSTWPRRLLAGMASFAVLFAWLFATSYTWLWYDQHASGMGSRILPWSYVVNVGRHFNRLALDGREQTLLPPATFDVAEPVRKEIVVLVIGEAARAEDFSLYGYAKDTNEFTEATSIVALPVGLSCATNTIASTACILTHEGRNASSYTGFEPLPSYLTRQGVETIYRTNNSGPPPVNVTTYERAGEIAERCATEPCPSPKLDEALNWGLGDILAASTSKRIFVVLHQTGSHGPAYYSRYPGAFSHFKPECKTVQIADCTAEELTNSYDNTIRYTDFLLADLIAQLKAIDADSVMIYVSDHGQSLGENGFYLHGAPNAVAPRQQREIPFLVWMSEGFMAHRELTGADIVPSETFPHDFPFHSVMGAFGMTSDIYKPEFDIFHMDTD